MHRVIRGSQPLIGSHNYPKCGVEYDIAEHELHPYQRGMQPLH
jgi:hypothetical protein